MLNRELTSSLKLYAQEFRSVLLVGPRQSGKTTLVRQCFPEKPYVSLENPDERMLADSDPRAFLSRFPQGAILDEIQRVPKLFNYLQEILDNSKKDGLFILTGSNNILLQDSLSQTLAGRMGILDLLPLSYRELSAEYRNKTLSELILQGGYPEIISKNRQANLWYSSYVRTYVERDVRQLKNIENAMLFTKFLKLCAGRIGQQLNVSALSNECGIDVKTVNSWLSVLESTYIIKLLQPFYQNFNKRIVKTPKLYFIDTGLACSLLSIRKKEELAHSHFRGALVENYLISECIKNGLNTQTGQAFYYWRDNKGLEIDLIIQNADLVELIEIKAAQTYTDDFTKNLRAIMKLGEINESYVLYDGLLEFEKSEGIRVWNWRSFLTR
jgi:predicted AAA+ superfamily ATPase